MTGKKFDPQKLNKLNNPRRLIDIPPEFICARLRHKTLDTVVEIGAGTAFFSVAFLRHLKPVKIYACDVAEPMLDWVKENVSPDYPNIMPVKSGEHSVPLDDGAADLVFMINLHHELENPLLMTKEAYRLLKPDGEIFIVDWKKEPMAEGPPQEIRTVPEHVKEELIACGFDGVSLHDQLPKHFLVVAQKIG
jgi:ubiquinone/menaquinone biosynthesis C-methylase UbiE